MTSILRKSLEAFVQSLRADFGPKIVFVIMRFADHLLLKTLYTIIKEEAAAIGVCALRADEKEYASQLWTNVEVYMLGCDAAIAVFDRVQSRGEVPTGFNPNVSIETGYVMGLDKPVLLLKDQYLELMPTDFRGMIYDTFNPDIPESARLAVRNWLKGVFGTKPGD